MRKSEPKPPRFNRYHVYLGAFGALVALVLLLRWMPSACGHAVHGYWPVHRCAATETWRWLTGGGNWEAWILVGAALLAVGVFITGLFRD